MLAALNDAMRPFVPSTGTSGSSLLNVSVGVLILPFIAAAAAPVQQLTSKAGPSSAIQHRSASVQRPSKAVNSSCFSAQD